MVRGRRGSKINLHKNILLQQQENADFEKIYTIQKMPSSEKITDIEEKRPPLSIVYKNMPSKDQIPTKKQKRQTLSAYETEEELIAYPNFIKGVGEYQAPPFNSKLWGLQYKY